MCPAEYILELGVAQTFCIIYQLAVPLWSSTILKKGQHGQQGKSVICCCEMSCPCPSVGSKLVSSPLRKARWSQRPEVLTCVHPWLLRSSGLVILLYRGSGFRSAGDNLVVVESRQFISSVGRLVAGEEVHEFGCQRVPPKYRICKLSIKSERQMLVLRGYNSSPPRCLVYRSMHGHRAQYLYFPCSSPQRSYHPLCKRPPRSPFNIYRPSYIR